MEADYIHSQEKLYWLNGVGRWGGWSNLLLQTFVLRLVSLGGILWRALRHKRRSGKNDFTVPKLFIQTLYFMLSIYFPSGNLGYWYWYMLGRGYLHEQLPEKILGRKSLMSFSSRQHLTCVATFQGWSNQVYPPWLHWRRLLQACAWFSSDFTMCLFLLQFCSVSFCCSTSQLWV